MTSLSVWSPLLLIVCGGGIGAGLRYLAGLGLTETLGLPWPTMIINLVGSFAIGVLVGGQMDTAWFNSWGKYLLVTGVLGGFTTYSAFAVETVQLLTEGRLVPALVYSVGTAVGSVVAAWLGLRLGLGLAS